MPGLALSSGYRGASWITNFAPEDRNTARLLLDSLEIVSGAEMRAGMERLLERVVQPRGDDRRDTAAIAIEGVPRRLWRHYFGCVPHHIASPDSPSCPKLDGTGSELIIKNAIEKISTESALRLIASVDDMRRMRSRVLLIVTDVLASGEEAANFAEFILRNPTIRSWRSYGLLRIEIAAYAASAAAVERLERSPVGLSFERYAADFDTAGWSDSEREDIERLCKRYAGPGGKPFGWAKARSLTVFDHTFGNGVPGVFLRKEEESWFPLLPGPRAKGLSPDDKERSSGYHPHPSVDALGGRGRHLPHRSAQLGRSGLPIDPSAAPHDQSRLILASVDDLRPVIALLAAIGREGADVYSVMKRANMTQSRVLEVLNRARRLELVNGVEYASTQLRNDTVARVSRRTNARLSRKLTLTGVGASVLARSGVTTRRSLNGATTVASESEAYYPTALR